jgi:putative transposase
MFFDEAGFGRINRPEYCWCHTGVRPIVPCHMVREYVYCFGAVDPIDGESHFIIAPQCNTVWTNEFLYTLGERFTDDYIVLCGDNASWHKSKELILPENILLLGIPPYTPEMNPIEQIWKEIRKIGFKNIAYKTLEKVIDKLCEVVLSLSHDTVKSITGRDWIVSMF